MATDALDLEVHEPWMSDNFKVVATYDLPFSESSVRVYSIARGYSLRLYSYRDRRYSWALWNDGRDEGVIVPIRTCRQVVLLSQALKGGQ